MHGSPSGQERPESREDHEKAFRDALPSLIREAQEARDNAVNYRGFLVGCSVFAWDAKTRTYRSFSAGNMRPVKGPSPPTGRDKLCAERYAIEQAEKAGVTRILGIVTASTEQHTGKNVEGHKVLRPCEECCQLIKDTPLIKPDSTFHGVHDDKPEQGGDAIVMDEEDMTIAQLLEEMASPDK